MSPAGLLHHLLDEAVTRHGRRPAVRQGQQVLTYQGLREESCRLASRLITLGIRRGDRVVLALPASPQLAPVLFACSRIGAVFVVIGADIPHVAAAHVLDNASPTLVVSESAEVLALADDHGVLAIRSEDLADTSVPRAASAAASVGPIPVDPACFIYTSGSTAMPRAVVSTHLQVTFVASAIQSRLAYQPGDIVFCALPLSFDYGLYQIFLCTLSGALLHLAGPDDAGQRLLVALRDSGATILPAVPSLAASLEWMLGRKLLPLPRLRLLTSTGAVMPAPVLAALRARLPELQIQLMYGLTECKRAAIMPPDEDLRRPGACGLALPGTEVFAADETGRRLPPGVTGELIVRGPHVMAGYWREPELTARRLRIEDGLYPQLRTGDYGWTDDDGYLYFAGRGDDLYKQRGIRVSTTEVEAAAYRVPGVQAAAVLPPDGVADGAVLLVKGDLRPEAVLRAMRQEIEEIKVPSRCMVLDDLPLNSHGKVERRQLHALAKDGTSA